MTFNVSVGSRADEIGSRGRAQVFHAGAFQTGQEAARTDRPCLLLTERTSAPVSLPALFFSWPNKRSKDQQTEGGLVAGLAPSLLLALLPFCFLFGCGALWTHAALRRFLLALAGFVAVGKLLQVHFMFAS